MLVLRLWGLGYYVKVGSEYTLVTDEEGTLFGDQCFNIGIGTLRVLEVGVYW